MAVHTQWRASGFGRVGLVYDEVRKWADRLGVEETEAFWRKIKALENDELKRQAETSSKGTGDGNHRNHIGSKKSRKGRSRR